MDTIIKELLALGFELGPQGSYDHADVVFKRAGWTYPIKLREHLKRTSLPLTPKQQEEIRKWGHCFGDRFNHTPDGKLAIRLLDACVRTMLAEATGTVSVATFERTCQLEQIDCIGLDSLEQRYLRLLDEAGGSLRLNVLASCLALPRPTLERAVEPFLIRRRLVEKTDQGRVLTTLGRQHLLSGSSRCEVAEGSSPCQ